MSWFRIRNSSAPQVPLAKSIRQVGPHQAFHFTLGLYAQTERGRHYRHILSVQEVGPHQAFTIEEINIPSDCPRLHEDCQSAMLQLDRYVTNPQWNGARESYQRLMSRAGRSGKKFPPAIDSLLEGIRRRGKFPNVNPVVDAYNLIALRFGLCIGAHDRDSLVGDITFERYKEETTLIPVNSSSSCAVRVGDYGYHDESGALALFDSRDADRVKLTPATRSIILVIQGAAEIPAPYAERALREASELIVSVAGGVYRLGLLAVPSSHLAQPNLLA